MITENVSTLKIHKLTQAQYDRELAAGTIDVTALYLTPDKDILPYVVNIQEDDYGAGYYLIHYDGTKFIEVTPNDVYQAYNNSRPIHASYYNTPLQLTEGSGGTLSLSNDTVTKNSVWRKTWSLDANNNTINFNQIVFEVNVPTNDDALEMLAETGIVDPATNDGYILTDADGVIYTL